MLNFRKPLPKFKCAKTNYKNTATTATKDVKTADENQSFLYIKTRKELMPMWVSKD